MNRLARRREHRVAGRVVGRSIKSIRKIGAIGASPGLNKYPRPIAERLLGSERRAGDRLSAKRDAHTRSVHLGRRVIANVVAKLRERCASGTVSAIDRRPAARIDGRRVGSESTKRTRERRRPRRNGKQLVAREEKSARVRASATRINTDYSPSSSGQ